MISSIQQIANYIHINHKTRMPGLQLPQMTEWFGEKYSLTQNLDVYKSNPDFRFYYHDNPQMFIFL